MFLTNQSHTDVLNKRRCHLTEKMLPDQHTELPIVKKLLNSVAGRISFD